MPCHVMSSPNQSRPEFFISRGYYSLCSRPVLSRPASINLPTNLRLLTLHVIVANDLHSGADWPGLEPKTRDSRSASPILSRACACNKGYRGQRRGKCWGVKWVLDQRRSRTLDAGLRLSLVCVVWRRLGGEGYHDKREMCACLEGRGDGEDLWVGGQGIVGAVEVVRGVACCGEIVVRLVVALRSGRMVVSRCVFACVVLLGCISSWAEGDAPDWRWSERGVVQVTS
ncbi:hypothetical protein BDV95DRAFT_183087 [Massariosphaeria phaeospora]|uniref:Uncharacterized protein n=1 Tax=Massariosphaeria phaeospora TaxID=100035 RepID=A0A7C8I8K6_9PLEO|nr:hypothetical protein BDV95DRAFT_183087 [Massariosphaeria phaeospora]